MEAFHLFDCQRVREKVESAQSSSPRRRIFQRSTEPARPLDQSAREDKECGRAKRRHVAVEAQSQ